MGIENQVKRWAKKAGYTPEEYWKDNKFDILYRANKRGNLNYSRISGSNSRERRAERRRKARLDQFT